MRIERLPLTDWAEALPARGFEPFHTAEALSVLDDYASGTLQLFAGYNGQNPVALLPVFVRRRAIGSMVTSPPPGFSVPRLGPILMPASPKRSKQERLNRRFAEAVGPGALSAEALAIRECVLEAIYKTRGAARITAAPTRHRPAPVRSQRSGLWPSAAHIQSSDAPM